MAVATETVLRSGWPGTHIRVTALTDRMGETGDRLSRWLNWVLAIPTFSFIAYLGYELAWRNRFTEFYTIDGAPRLVFYLAVPVSFTLMVLAHLFLARRLLRAPEPTETVVELPRVPGAS